MKMKYDVVASQAYHNLVVARYTTGEQWPEPATTELYNALKQYAKAVHRTLTGTSDEDVETMAIENAMLNIDSFSKESSFVTWFSRILKNEITDEHRRRNQRDHEICLSPKEWEDLNRAYEVEDTLKEIAGEYTGSPESQRVERFLKEFPDKFSEDEIRLLELRLKNFSLQEIANNLDISLDATEKRAQRLRLKLLKLASLSKETNGTEERPESSNS